MTSGRPPRRTVDLERRLEALRGDRETARRLAELRARRDRSLRRHLAVLGAVLLVMLAVHLTRRIDNPERAPAVAVAEAMDAAFRAWVAGELEVSAEPSPVGELLLGAEFELFGRPRTAVTAEAAGECYAAFWDEEGHRQARVLSDRLPCRPGPLVASSSDNAFVRFAVVVRDPDAAYPWDRLLPPRERERYWYLPAMVALGGVALSVLTRIVTILITGRPAGELSGRR